MEFTARVGSILRGLLPRRWITESGRQRLGGLFECLLQEAGMPPPTFYAATLSVCSGNRLASPVHTYCAWIRSSPLLPSHTFPRGRISKHEHERFLSQLFHPIGRFHWKFPREKVVLSYRVPWILCFLSPDTRIDPIRKFSSNGANQIIHRLFFTSYHLSRNQSSFEKKWKDWKFRKKLGNVDIRSILERAKFQKFVESRLIRNSRLDLVTTRFNPTGDKIEVDRS